MRLNIHTLINEWSSLCSVTHYGTKSYIKYTQSEVWSTLLFKTHAKFNKEVIIIFDNIDHKYNKSRDNWLFQTYYSTMKVKQGQWILRFNDTKAE